VAECPARNAQDVGQHILCFLFVSDLTSIFLVCGFGVERMTAEVSRSDYIWLRFVRLSQKASLSIKKTRDKLQ